MKTGFFFFSLCIWLTSSQSSVLKEFKLWRLLLKWLTQLYLRVSVTSPRAWRVFLRTRIENFNWVWVLSSPLREITPLSSTRNHVSFLTRSHFYLCPKLCGRNIGHVSGQRGCRASVSGHCGRLRTEGPLITVTYWKQNLLGLGVSDVMVWVGEGIAVRYVIFSFSSCSPLSWGKHSGNRSSCI